MLQVNLETWLFYNGWVLAGLILLLWSIISMIIASSSSFTLGKISKINKSRSRPTRHMLLVNTYASLVIGLFCLIYGFSDKFNNKQEKAPQVTHAKLTEEFKKCSRFREGYCLCRTYDKQSTWVLIRQADGTQLYTYTFPDELEVIGVGLFENGISTVTGRPHSRREKVAEVDTLGKVVIFK